MDANPYAETVIGGEDPMNFVASPSRGQLRWLFFGLLITLLDFRLNEFNMLPDVLGLVIVFFVSLQLVPVSNYFSRAAGFAIALVVAWCMSFAPDLNELRSVVWYISQAGLVWSLINGLAYHIQVTRGPDAALFARKIAFVFGAAQVFMLTFDLVATDFDPLETAASITSLVCLIIVLVSVWKAGSATPRSV